MGCATACAELKLTPLRELDRDRLNSPTELIRENSNVDARLHPFHVKVEDLNVQIIVDDEERPPGGSDDRFQILVELIVIAWTVGALDLRVRQEHFEFLDYCP